MDPVIGAHHEFHDAKFVAGWADRFVPTPERLALFEVILSELRAQIPRDGIVVELGIGPGYLADYLLQAIPEIKYYGVDFSRPMLEIARQRLRPHSDRLTLVEADLVNDHWWTKVPAPMNAIISTWALHDLGSQEKVEVVYQASAQGLEDGGIFLNGDFIKPDKAIYEYEPGRFGIAKHLEILRRVGFRQTECLIVLEEEIAAPTAAQNYACFKGVV